MTINLAQTPVPSIQEQLVGSIEVKFSPGDFVVGDLNEPFQLDLKFWGVFSENIFHLNRVILYMILREEY